MARIVVLGAGLGGMAAAYAFKMRHGTSEPIYEKYIMGLLGIERLKNGKHCMSIPPFHSAIDPFDGRLP